MATFEEKMALREQGMTYREIAKELGISHQAVSQTLAKSKESQFKKLKPEKCVFVGLRNWMNENKVSIGELTRLCGILPQPNSRIRFSHYLKGENEMRMGTIEKILEITGLTYEEGFKRG